MIHWEQLPKLLSLIFKLYLEIEGACVVTKKLITKLKEH